MHLICILILLSLLPRIQANVVKCADGIHGTCFGQRCYKNRTHRGCADINSCRSFTNETNCSHSLKPCCCSQNLCNQIVSGGAVTSNDGPRFSAQIAVLVMVCIFFGACLTFFLIRMKMQRKKPKRSSSSKRSISSRPQGKSNLREKNEKSSTEHSSSPIWEHDNVIDHVDRTNIKIEAFISAKTKRQLIRHLMNGPPSLESRRSFEKPPKIVKVITYATSEHITLLESPPSNRTSKGPIFAQDSAAELLVQMVENGPREFSFDRNQLIEILNLGAQIFINEGSLIEVPVPCIIYGDTHGQYSDLLRWFNLNGWPNMTRSVFLGDFVDRGSHGVELFTLLTCLKVCFPKNLFIIRGNHEEENLNQLYSFVSEVHFKFDASKHAEKTESMYEHFKKVFVNLPLACLIGGDILGMHGGISPQLRTLQDIRDIRRPIEEFMKGTLACDLVWSDPDTNNKVVDFEPNFERESTVGIGQLFSQSAVKDACARLGVKMIVRGHQASCSLAPLHGYARWANGHLITLFSAPAYKGTTEETVNMGACIEACVSGELIVKQLKAKEWIRKKRENDVYNRQMVQAKMMGDADFLERA
ncbi:hypothetical protein Angca_004610 [Angiostrongylus cantonensis]|nr:hypothetical protein Angca_004610 [Angiostrongylus cantonensis]